MNRRETLKALMATSGALVALPAWAHAWHADGIAPFPPALSVQEQSILASVVDTIIPAGNAIGALSVGVDKFIQKLLQDCYEQDVRDNVKSQLDRLARSAQEQYGRSFQECGQEQREGMLMKLASSEQKDENDFFNLMKSETIRGFSTSREVMVSYHKFRPVPGHYHGCVDINP